MSFQILENVGRPEAVFFDWDDTIFDNERICKVVFEEMIIESPELLKPHMYPRKPSISLLDSVMTNFEEYAGAPITDAIATFFNGDPDVMTKKFRDFYAIAKADVGIQLRDGAKKSVSLVTKAQIPIGVISNKERETLESEMKASDMLHHFYTVIGVKDAPRCKPYTDQVDLAVEKYHEKTQVLLNLKKCWFIGDSNFDMECAKSAGCVPIYIGHKSAMNEKTERMLESGSLIIVQDHRELQKIINQYCK